MKDINDLIVEVSNRSGHSEDLVSLILRYYWRDLRVKINNKSGCFLNIGGFGRIAFKATEINRYCIKQRESFLKYKYRFDNYLRLTDLNKLIIAEQMVDIKNSVINSLKLYEIYKERTKDKVHYVPHHILAKKFNHGDNKYIKLEEFDTTAAEAYIEQKKDLRTMLIQRKASLTDPKV